MEFPSYKKYKIEIYDARSQKLSTMQGELNSFGAFDTEFKIPDNANLGQAKLNIKLWALINSIPCNDLGCQRRILSRIL